MVPGERSPPRQPSWTSRSQLSGWAAVFPEGPIARSSSGICCVPGQTPSSTSPPAGGRSVGVLRPGPGRPAQDVHVKRGVPMGPVDQFDAETFGSPPAKQWRWTPSNGCSYEVTWEALEDTGMPVGGLVGSSTGVYVGINTGDYMQLLSTSGLPEHDAYVATGNTFSVAAGRALSYLFGLQGRAWLSILLVRRRSSPPTWPAGACTNAMSTWLLSGA